MHLPLVTVCVCVYSNVLISGHSPETFSVLLFGVVDIVWLVVGSVQVVLAGMVRAAELVAGSLGRW